MKFTIHYDEAVLDRAARHFIWKRVIRGFGASGLLALVICLGALGYLLWQGESLWVVGIICAVLAFLGLGIILLWRMRLADMRRKLSAIPSRQAQVELSDDAITIATETSSTSLSWTGFEDLWQLDDFWLLFLAQNNFVTIPTWDVPNEALDFIAAKVPASNAKPKAQ